MSDYRYDESYNHTKKCQQKVWNCQGEYVVMLNFASCAEPVDCQAEKNVPNQRQDHNNKGRSWFENHWPRFSVL